jgi:tripartite-type tricarboxylate transporter receptor subunit TctC
MIRTALETPMIRLTRRAALGLIALAASPAFGQATDFPSKPIRMLVPFAAGSADSSARVLAERCRKPRLIGHGREPPAPAAIAAVAVRQAPADGYDHDRINRRCR